jgi:hypothetical protein
VGGLIGTKKELVRITALGSKSLSQLFYRKVLRLVLPLTNGKRCGAAFNSAGPLRVDCAVKHSTSAAYLDIKEDDD